MISKSILIGAAAAVVATATGYFVATGGSNSTCNGGCPIKALFGSQDTTVTPPTSDSVEGCSSCCSKVSRTEALIKSQPVDSPTLAACVGGPAYVTHAQPANCCADE